MLLTKCIIWRVEPKLLYFNKFAKHNIYSNILNPTSKFFWLPTCCAPIFCTWQNGQPKKTVYFTMFILTYEIEPVVNYTTENGRIYELNKNNSRQLTFSWLSCWAMFTGGAWTNSSPSLVCFLSSIYWKSFFVCQYLYLSTLSIPSRNKGIDRTLFLS